MVKYPLFFKAQAESISGIMAPWQAHVGTETFVCAIPPEFEGPGQGLSPEDFYILALSNCFIATLKVIAEKSQVTFEKVSVDGVLCIDRDEKGRPWAKSASFEVKVVNPSNSDKMLKLLQKTSESCIMLNSVKTEKTFNFVVA